MCYGTFSFHILCRHYFISPEQKQQVLWDLFLERVQTSNNNMSQKVSCLARNRRQIFLTVHQVTVISTTWLLFISRYFRRKAMGKVIPLKLHSSEKSQTSRGKTHVKFICFFTDNRKMNFPWNTPVSFLIYTKGRFWLHSFKRKLSVRVAENPLFSNSGQHWFPQAKK